MKKIQKNAARFDNLKQDFLDDKKYSGTAEATLNGYRYDITRFLKFLSDEQLAVNEAGFKRYVIHLTDSGMTANSVNHYIRLVKMFFYWCISLFVFLIQISIAAMGSFPKNQNAKFGNSDSKIFEHQKSTLSGAMFYCCSFNPRLYLK